ncbi:hypothetical protein PsAD13_03890 [Pseudovibrio sp. Ad13]|uniref:hypothetical protein n=1 Tax=Pseudovibrio sp. Ad13 TaxID=989396 RepID=UPI0007B2C771|nr:hypothetical protein [Pseudovibrio sp. Ad13]KZK82331.1 hypothetical protein PsAD13_03890 [Pseudovibrio sp. Ad13]
MDVFVTYNGDQLIDGLLSGVLPFADLVVTLSQEQIWSEFQILLIEPGHLQDRLIRTA